MKELFEIALKGATPKVLAFDPGETTGACVFEGSVIKDARQIATGLMPLGAVAIRTYINEMFPSQLRGPFKPDVVVIEDYRIYSWKTKDHTWAGLHTPRLIGAIELICHDLQVPLVKQTAQQGKGFCTDDKLKAWDLYQVGERHARDAIRHACYYLLFTVGKLQEVRTKKV